MNIVTWMLAGGILGWVGFKFLGFSEGRGLMISIVIGALGGILGGKLVAPMFADTAAVPDAFSMTALVIAAAVAAAALGVGNLVYKRWGV